VGARLLAGRGRCRFRRHGSNFFGQRCFRDGFLLVVFRGQNQAADTVAINRRHLAGSDVHCRSTRISPYEDDSGIDHDLGSLGSDIEEEIGAYHADARLRSEHLEMGARFTHLDDPATQTAAAKIDEGFAGCSLVFCDSNLAFLSNTEDGPIVELYAQTARFVRGKQFIGAHHVLEGYGRRVRGSSVAHSRNFAGSFVVDAAAERPWAERQEQEADQQSDSAAQRFEVSHKASLCLLDRKAYHGRTLKPVVCGGAHHDRVGTGRRGGSGGRRRSVPTAVAAGTLARCTAGD